MREMFHRILVFKYKNNNIFQGMQVHISLDKILKFKDNQVD